MHLPLFFLSLITAASTFSTPGTLCAKSYDILSIKNTLSLYPLAIDGKNFSLLASVFTTNAVANYSAGVGVLNGLDQIGTVLAASLAPVLTQHALSTQLITISANASTTESVTYYTASHFGQGVSEGQVLYAYGKYLDTLVKINENKTEPEWRIERRNLVYMGPLIGNLSVFGS